MSPITHQYTHIIGVVNKAIGRLLASENDILTAGLLPATIKHRYESKDHLEGNASEA